MNGIVRVIDKPANLIDVLRSERAKEAQRLRKYSTDSQLSSVDTLAAAVAAAEVMVLTPRVSGARRRASSGLRARSVADIKRELGVALRLLPGQGHRCRRACSVRRQ